VFFLHIVFPHENGNVAQWEPDQYAPDSAVLTDHLLSSDFIGTKECPDTEPME